MNGNVLSSVKICGNSILFFLKYDNIFDEKIFDKEKSVHIAQKGASKCKGMTKVSVEKWNYLPRVIHIRKP